MFARLARQSSKHLHRSLSTAPKGLSSILEKRPDDVVITFAKRTAMGRAKKGQLKDVPVDELMHALFKVRTAVCNPFSVELIPMLIHVGYPGEDRTQPPADWRHLRRYVSLSKACFVGPKLLRQVHAIRHPRSMSLGQLLLLQGFLRRSQSLL